MLSLYIHTPFCVRKCPYCGFYSTLYSEQRAEDYVAALRNEALGYRSDFSRRLFSTVYIGGGTPTVLSNEQSARVMRLIKDCFNVTEDAEFTVEANPHSAAQEGLSQWQRLGVNRLSLGIQSFSDRVLQKLGRLHTADQAVDAFRSARSAGFTNIGIDLIYGAPGQTMAQWGGSLAAATRLTPEHISLYSLSLDEGSAFKRKADSGTYALPDDELVIGMYEHAVSTLFDAGYARYEISNFALPGFECRHNMNYWERGEYLGLGPGASSYVAGKRFDNIPDHEEYARRLARGQSAIVDCEEVTAEQAARERLLLGLRTSRGVDLRRFHDEQGNNSFRRLQASLPALSDAGLIRIIDGRMRLTDRGSLLCNEVLTRLAV